MRKRALDSRRRWDYVPPKSARSGSATDGPCVAVAAASAGPLRRLAAAEHSKRIALESVASAASALSNAEGPAAIGIAKGVLAASTRRAEKATVAAAALLSEVNIVATVKGEYEVAAAALRVAVAACAQAETRAAADAARVVVREARILANSLAVKLELELSRLDRAEYTDHLRVRWEAAIADAAALKAVKAAVEKRDGPAREARAKAATALKDARKEHKAVYKQAADARTAAGAARREAAFARAKERIDHLKTALPTGAPLSGDPACEPTAARDATPRGGAPNSPALNAALDCPPQPRDCSDIRTASVCEALGRVWARAASTAALVPLTSAAAWARSFSAVLSGAETSPPPVRDLTRALPVAAGPAALSRPASTPGSARPAAVASFAAVTHAPQLLPVPRETAEAAVSGIRSAPALSAVAMPASPAKLQASPYGSGCCSSSHAAAVPSRTPAAPLVSLTQVLIRTLTGKTITLDVKPSDTIYIVKRMIEDKEGTPAGQQRLVVSGRQPRDEITLADCGIRQHATLVLALRMHGGMEPAGGAPPSSPAAAGAVHASIDVALAAATVAYVKSERIVGVHAESSLFSLRSRRLQRSSNV